MTKITNLRLFAKAAAEKEQLDIVVVRTLKIKESKGSFIIYKRYNSTERSLLIDCPVKNYYHLVFTDVDTCMEGHLSHLPKLL